MAKITIELDTNESSDDRRILGAVADVFRDGNADAAAEAERAFYETADDGEQPLRAEWRDYTPVTGVEDRPKRTRRTKAQIEADNAAQATPAASSPVSAGAGPVAMTTANPGPAPTTIVDAGPFAPPVSAPEITAEAVNNQLRALLKPGSGHNAASLIAVVNKATEGTASSVREADPKYLPALHAALAALGAPS